jgi:hypothetical protein
MGKGSSPRPFTDRAVFEDNFDKIFGKKKQSRIDTVGQNGNDGLHYEYELNKSTGDVEKRFTDGTSKPNESQFDGN